MTRPQWYEQLAGRPDPGRRTGGRWRTPVAIDEEIAVTTREGTRVRVHEIRPGLLIVASQPSDAAMRGAVEVGALGQEEKQQNAGFWVGIANGVSGLVTNLGDWVAGWFPKANETKQKRLEGEQVLAMREDAYLRGQNRQDLEIAARLEQEKTSALVEAAVKAAFQSFPTTQPSSAAAVDAVDAAAPPAVAGFGLEDIDVGCIDLNPYPDVGAGRRGRGGAGARRQGGGHGHAGHAQADGRMVPVSRGGHHDGPVLCQCGGTCGGC